jgi:diguanylate cyclase (GGDEF)-like protein
VVGDRGIGLRVEALLPSSQREHGVIRVGGFLAGLAEAALRPVAAVIGPATGLTGMAGSTAASLRQLLPEARLILIDDPLMGPEVREARQRGFDRVLPPDASDAELADALGLELPDHEPSAPSLVPADPADLSDLFPDPGPGEPTRPAKEAHVDDDPDDVALPEDLADTPCIKIGHDHDGALGDIDLVDHILQGQADLSALALRLIRAQGGIEHVALAGADGPPSDHLGAEVRHGRHHFGTLHAPRESFEASPAPALTPAQLQVWADWLARWLALEARFVRLRDLSMRDELTGAWNRRYFNRFLKRIVDRAAEQRQQVTLMVFDIDDFKQYNDAYGHAAGDEILREVARLMMTSVREHDVVARIGGDEFAVIFWDAEQPRRPHSRHPDDVLNAAKRFQRAVIDHRFPKLLDKAAGNLTISGGLAGFPWDGRTPDDLLEFADAMAGRSKRQGKNAITVGPGAMAEPEAD